MAAIVPASLDRHIQSYLRHSASLGREVERIGPFLATFTPHSDLIYINYAIPDDDAEPSTSEIDALVKAFLLRNRTPRLEYIPSAAPKLEAELRSAGFVEEQRTPLMTCCPGDVVHRTVPDGFELLPVDKFEEAFALSRALCEAYGQPEQNQADVESSLAAAARGSVSLAIWDQLSGECAGGGTFTTPYRGVTEVAGIGIRPLYQRRGLATALTGALASTAFEAGVELAFLMAGSDGAERAYLRAGFNPVGEVLHISMRRGCLGHQTL